MKNRLDTFKGIIPAVEPSLLPESVAQEAHNCDLTNGKLVPLNACVPTDEQVTDDIETIYHFRAFGKGDCELPLPDPYWVKFPFDADFAPSPINGDKYERVYYTGNPDKRFHQLLFGEESSTIIDNGADLKPPTENISDGGHKDLLKMFELYFGVWDEVEDEDGNKTYSYYVADEPLPHNLEKLTDATFGENEGGSMLIKYIFDKVYHIDITGHSEINNPDFNWGTRFAFFVKITGISGRYNAPDYSPFYNPDLNDHYHFFMSKGPEAGKIIDLIDPYWQDYGYPDYEIKYGHLAFAGADFDDSLSTADYATNGNFLDVTPLPADGRDIIEVTGNYDFTKNGGMNLASAREYNYIYQYVDAHGTPSPIYGEHSIDIHEDAFDDAVLTIPYRWMFERLLIKVPPVPDVTNTGQPIKYVRIYRNITHSQSGGYFLCKEIEITDTSDVDNPYQWNGDGDYLFPEWAKEIPGFDFDPVHPPPDCMKGLVIHPGKFLAAFKNDAVFMSEVNAPYSWSYQVTIDSPIVGIAINGSDIVVMTTGTPTILSGVNPGNMRLTKMALQQSCVSKKSICKVDEIVTYASPDGIVFISGGQGKLATKGLIHPKQWRALQPEKMVSVQHDGKVWFTPGVKDVSYCFDPKGDYLSLITVDGDFSVSYNDLFDDALYFIDPDSYICAFDAKLDENMEMRWHTARFDYNLPVMYLKCRVISEGYPVYLDVYVDKKHYKRMTIASERVYNMPLRRRDEIWSFKVTSVYTIRRLELGQSMDDFMG